MEGEILRGKKTGCEGTPSNYLRATFPLCQQRQETEFKDGNAVTSGKGWKKEKGGEALLGKEMGGKEESVGS